MSRILITGCSGFLAHFLINQLREEGSGHDIHGLTEVTDFKSDRFHVHNLDIRDSEKIDLAIKSLRPDIVYHLAAVSNVAYSWKNPKLTYEVNFIGSSNLFESLHRYCPESRVVLMSSAELYGKGSNEPIAENHPVVIRNPYALSKRAMEIAGDMYAGAMGMDIIKVRSFNFTGPGQDKHFVCSDFAYQIARIEKGGREPVIRVGNLSAVRDFSDVRDIALYLVEIGKRGESGFLYHVCSGIRNSIQSVLDRLLSISEVEIEIVVDQSKFRPVDTPILVGDCSLLKRKFNCHPRFEFSQTLEDILNDWRYRIQ